MSWWVFVCKQNIERAISRHKYSLVVVLVFSRSCIPLITSYVNCIQMSSLVLFWLDDWLISVWVLFLLMVTFVCKIVILSSNNQIIVLLVPRTIFVLTYIPTRLVQIYSHISCGISYVVHSIVWCNSRFQFIQ